LAEQAGGIQLRYLQTLTEISVEKNSTIIFPVPIEFVRAFSGMLEAQKIADESNSQEIGE
jgi:hypothetical protein